MDEWAHGYDSILPIRQLHAIGVVSVGFALSERYMQYMIWGYSGLDWDVGSLHTFDNSPGTLANKLKYLVETHPGEKNEHLREAVLHGVKGFEVCQFNRNKVAHFSTDLQFSKLVTKPNRGAKPVTQTFDASLPQLRAAADSCVAFNNYLTALHLLTASRLRQRSGTQDVTPELLPEKPSLPEPLPRAPLQAQQ